MAEKIKNVATPVVGAADQMKTLKDTQVSLGNLRSADYPGVKTSGVKIRGTGAATKGVMARGPMC